MSRSVCPVFATFRRGSLRDFRACGWPEAGTARTGNSPGVLTAVPPTSRGRLIAQLGRTAVDRALREGELVVVRRGVLAGRRCCLPDVAFRVLAQQARIRGPSWASHGTAGELHKLDRLGRASGAVRLLKSSGGAWRDAEVSVGVAQLPPHHVTNVAGVPATSIARTVVDLGRRSTLVSAVVLADSALRRGCTTAELEQVLADCRDWPGLPKAAAAVAQASPLAESVLESVSRAVFVRHRLPAPELQVSVGDSEGFIGRVDFLWREQRVVGESDGMGKYTDILDLHAEKVRQERLECAGFTIIRWTWDDIWTRSDWVVARLARALGLSNR